MIEDVTPLSRKFVSIGTFQIPASIVGRFGLRLLMLLFEENVV
jgi:hypothetical protein